MAQLKKCFNVSLSFLEEKRNVGDMFIAIMLALFPLLQHYKGLIHNTAITALVVISGYLILRMIKDIPTVRFANIGFILPIVIYYLYRVVNHGTTITEIGQSLVLIVCLIALVLGKINTKAVIKVGRIVSIVASICMIVQYIAFYIFGVHLQMVATSLLIPSASQWILGAQTGLAGVTGRIGNFYRPSAFFLEPAHVYIYMIPQVILLLFEEKINKKSLLMAVLISLGIVLSTSGMGIAAVFGTWVLFIAFYNEKDGNFDFKNILRKRNLIAISIIIVLFILAAIYVPFVRQAVKRIFVPGRFGKNAITGRISKALKLVGTMGPLQWIFGVADNTHGLNTHMPGMLDVFYRHGIIGLLLSYELYVKCIFKLGIAYKFLGAVILVTSIFSAHTHSTIGMLFLLIFLFNGFQDRNTKEVRSYSEINPKNKVERFIAKLFSAVSC